ncbi:alpha-L-rhamnosidase [Microbacterium sp. ZXX196]|uniref:alpha-L-rhamnosidase n=1 Tax=Microbacterium sp. ZXX196 TaxID=2609291 RepID=UPI0012B7AD18|nr:alpha-L-rhamnosidase [Microbacterium sp. ZXX196]MTE23243.1 Bacterial alpha-L-rhamnosidase [Microbacterium sp. ZXX196]
MSHAVTRTRVGRRGAPAIQSSSRPALTWVVEGADAGWLQAGASIELRRADGSRERVEHAGRDSANVAWPFAPLAAYDAVDVRVSAVSEAGEYAAFSEWTPVATGPLGADEWTAPFIASRDDRSEACALDATVARGATAADVRADLAADDADRGVTRLRRIVDIERPVARALLSYTGHGIVELTIDGREVSDDLFAPGWTAYADRLLFRTVDVTAELAEGTRILGARVAPGWYAEHFGFDGDFRRTWHGQRALSAQLRVEFADGTVDTIVTDETWEASIAGPVTFSSIYQGERYDARREDEALAAAVPFPGAAPAVRVAADPTRLRPAELPPVRVTETRDVVQRLAGADGGVILDFGQNLVGRLRIRLAAEAGTVVTLRHAEVLEQGELGRRPLRFAAASDTYVASGGPAEWAPRFTFHGFRYAQVDGISVDQIEVVAEVLHTDLVRTGTLRTGVADLDRLHENVVWGTRGNFVTLPTDCPQRDERLGWTGDIQVFAPTASFLFDVDGFLSSWLEDFAADQARLGGVGPLYSPLIDQDLFAPTPMAAWSDAATVVPTVLYERFGDRDVLERQFASMSAWVERVAQEAPNGHWHTGMQLADWLDPSAPADRPFEAQTDPYLVATAYYARSAALTARAARILDRAEDAARFEALAETARQAFQREYVFADGRLASDSQTAYALAIVFELLPHELYAPAGQRLATIVADGGHRIGTGFVGTPIVSDALTVTGHRDVAQGMLRTAELPSWLYPVSRGATTVWERWDSMLPDGTINPGEMTSFNHYALGAVADWMHRDMGGIAPLEPGYRRVLVRPRAGLTAAAGASYSSVYGEIRVAWSALEPERGELSPLAVTVTLPANTTAMIDLPGREALEVGSGTHTF